jgi:phosphatidylinositol kinase/protein kinase (PI-3  family)
LKPEEECKGIQFNKTTGQYVLGSHRVPRSFLDLEMDRPNIPEEFNKKVFQLIEMATDDTRRCQKQIYWCPWF